MLAHSEQPDLLVYAKAANVTDNLFPCFDSSASLIGKQKF